MSKHLNNSKKSYGPTNCQMTEEGSVKYGWSCIPSNLCEWGDSSIYSEHPNCCEIYFCKFRHFNQHHDCNCSFMLCCCAPCVEWRSFEN